jgi:hypothetical protein
MRASQEMADGVVTVILAGSHEDLLYVLTTTTDEGSTNARQGRTRHGRRDTSANARACAGGHDLGAASTPTKPAPETTPSDPAPAMAPPSPAPAPGQTTSAQRTTASRTTPTATDPLSNAQTDRLATPAGSRERARTTAASADMTSLEHAAYFPWLNQGASLATRLRHAPVGLDRAGATPRVRSSHLTRRVTGERRRVQARPAASRGWSSDEVATVFALAGE